MQLIRLAAAGALWAWMALPGAARADEGQVYLRSIYYKERSTRVIEPMLDAEITMGDAQLEAHLLVDSVTSASVAAGALGAAFTENRVEAGLGAAYQFPSYLVGLFGRYSNEPDYKSIFVGARSVAELADKNTTLALAIAMGRDDVSNAGAQGGGMGESLVVEGELSTALASVSLTQLMSERWLAGVTYDVIYLDGFQENPYREVIAQGMRVAERVPDTRLRHAMFGNVRVSIPEVRAVVMAGYRYYFDDWGLRAHTPQLRWVQNVDDGIDVHLRYRFHQQNAADFYKDVYDFVSPTEEPYITDDKKLSEFSAHLMGIKVETALARFGVQGALGKIRTDAGFEYVVQDNDFGNALVLQLGMVIPFER